MACKLGGSPKHICGYCRLHRCTVTVKQLKSRRCLQKQCRALVRVDHPFWAAREKSKQLRKTRKERETEI